MSQELMEAVKANDTTRVRDLIAADPELINRLDESGSTPVLTALYYGAMEVSELLLLAGAKLSIYEAAAAGRTELVSEEVEVDPGLVNSYSHDGWTPLHLAAFFGHAQTASFLLEHGADVHAMSMNPTNNTPLHAACANGKREVAEVLLDHGADVNAVSRGFTPLHLAAVNGDEELVELLLSAGADVNAHLDTGETLRELASQKGHERVVDLLSRQS